MSPMSTFFAFLEPPPAGFKYTTAFSMALKVVSSRRTRLEQMTRMTSAKEYV